jgi:hypothetical protein
MEHFVIFPKLKMTGLKIIKKSQSKGSIFKKRKEEKRTKKNAKKPGHRIRKRCNAVNVPVFAHRPPKAAIL